MAFGFAVAPIPMTAVQCAAGDCGTAGVAMAVIPELGGILSGANLARAARSLSAAGIYEKVGGFAQATKDFGALKGAEKTIGPVKIKELADGSKAVLRNFSKDSRPDTGNPTCKRGSHEDSVQLMTPIAEPSQLERYRHLLSEMMLPLDQCEFSPDWVREHGWKVVPVESMARLPQPDIPRLVSVLNDAGSSQCVALATEPLGEMPMCYAVSVEAADLREVNRELGPFRFLLSDDGHSWAISCTEWYNLFAGKPELLEAMLGKPIDQARQDYIRFASELAKDQPDEPLLKVAAQYASL